MIACLTLLPPSPSGVAGVSVEFLSRLMRRGEDVKIFVGDMRSRLALPGWPIYDARKFEGDGPRRMYHLGNNKMHRFAYDAALRWPGVVVFHDVLQQHMLLGESWGAWEREFAFTYGERGREIAANLRDGIPATHEGFFRYPLVKRVVEASRRVIVTNPGGRARVLRESPSADVRVIPLSFGPQPSRELTRWEARAALELPQDAFIVGCFGYMREARQLPTVLRVYEEFQRRTPRAQFVLVGEFTTPEQEHFLSPRLRALGVRRPGHVSDAEMMRWGAACDVVVNLRHPSAGESSGILLQSMRLGLPVIVTDSAEVADYPDDACIKIAHGEMEEAMLLEFLVALEKNPELGAAIGAKAREYVAREHDPEHAIDLYLEALEP